MRLSDEKKCHIFHFEQLKWLLTHMHKHYSGGADLGDIISVKLDTACFTLYLCLSAACKALSGSFCVGSGSEAQCRPDTQYQHATG